MIVGVKNRLRLLMGANALVYLGPLLAGMAGFGWAAVPAFAAILIFWLVLLDPRGWRHARRDWINGRAAVQATGRILIQVLLVAILFGIGRGIAGVVGIGLELPLVQVMALSFFALPLTRLVWRPEQAAARRVAERMVERLNTLPENSDDAEILAHVVAIRQHVCLDDLHAALTRFAAREDARRTVSRALALVGSGARPAPADA